MTLESAVDKIMDEAFKWVEEYQGGEWKMVSGFPSVFIHYCKGLVNVGDLKISYRDLGFLKPKFMEFDIQNKEIKYLKFAHCDEYNDVIRNQINKYINDYLRCKKNVLVYENYVEKSYKSPTKETFFINLEAMENINFSKY